MLIEPGIKVNDVVEQPAPEANGSRSHLHKQGDANPKVFSGLLAGKAALTGQGQGTTVTFSPHVWLYDNASHHAGLPRARPEKDCMLEACCTVGPSSSAFNFM